MINEHSSSLQDPIASHRHVYQRCLHACATRACMMSCRLLARRHSDERPVLICCRFLSRVRPVFFLRARDYSKSVAVAPFIINYSGALFREYPGPWQVRRCTLLLYCCHFALCFARALIEITCSTTLFKQYPGFFWPVRRCIVMSLVT
jgi:hypothetical protein